MSPSPTQHLEIEVDVRDIISEVGTFEVTIKTHFKRFWLLKLGLNIIIFGSWVIGVNEDKVKIDYSIVNDPNNNQPLSDFDKKFIDRISE